MGTKKYPGELGRKKENKLEGPMIAAMLQKDRAEFDRLYDLESTEKIRKLLLLMEHFEIDSGETEAEMGEAFYRLALELARAHVPAFQKGRNAGRPRTWDDHTRVAAAMALERQAAANPRLNRTQLAERMLKDERWSSLSKTAGALLKQIDRGGLLPEGFKLSVRAFHLKWEGMPKEGMPLRTLLRTK